MQRGIKKLVATAIAAGAMLLSGCSAPTASGGGGSETPVRFQMHWSWSASTAGFAVAQADGLYKEAGIDAKIEQGTGSGTAVQLVANGQADVGIADAVPISQQIEKGAPLVIVATVNQVTNIAMQVMESSGINSVQDLKGKTVAVPQGSAHAFLFPLFLEANGLTESDVTISNVPFASMPAALLQGNVDAIVGGQDTAVSLEKQNVKFKNFLFADYGVSPVAHSIFTTQSYAEKNPDAVKKFVSASLKGLSSARDNPEHAVAAVKQLLPDSVDDTVRAELKFLLPLLCAADAKVIGRAEAGHWQQSNELLTRAKLLPAPLDTAKSVSYDFLPPESELKSCK
ncbi:ABC transporter substrate-binding protein [Arthrobacter oryzae]|uniref:ABC transporter substrate-binding protein n=1 Tax=Arthrobacter oryzae TaxID=409290 RepID=UPI002858A0CE|nr:ABC transporter substrate-binding protein [Arthrobacter oryzae]MDR6509107.1 NitT/TauT family transport system substrate-binding protein [Arthrobacter oryzae]